MDCPKCDVYVYDVLINPLSIGDCLRFGPLINQRRAMKHLHLLVPEFIRIAIDDTDIEHAAILFVDADGCSRPPCLSMGCVMTVARMWVRSKLKEIGDLDSIHAYHGGYASPLPPAEPLPTAPLRIRIPGKNRNND